MNETKFQKNEEMEIDIGRVVRTVWERIWLVALVTVLSGAIVFAASFFLITPKYQASAKFYVNNNSI